MSSFMHYLRTTLLVLAVAQKVAGQAPSEGATWNPEVANAIAQLDARLRAIVASSDIPSLSIGIVDDQQLVWAKSYGFANVEKRIPASPSTVYRIASVSKVFTATAVMQLRDAGRLQLDDPVIKHLPLFKTKQRLSGTPPVTIWNLLTHTSGLPNPGVIPAREETYRFLADHEMLFPPGTEFRYSNVGYAVLGEIIAAASGEPFPAYVEKHILVPLGMSSTFVLAEPQVPGLAVPYLPRRPGADREKAGYLYRDPARLAFPAGGVTTTIHDLAKFASTHFVEGDRQILSPFTWREMERPHWLQPDWQSGVGLGWESVSRIGSQLRVGMEGGSTGWNAKIVLAPQDKLAAVVLVNTSGVDTSKLIDAAFETVGNALRRSR